MPKRNKYEVYLKIAVVGDPGSGKSSLIRYFRGLPFNPHYECDQTYSISRHHLTTKHNLYKIELWDSGACHLENNKLVRKAFLNNSTAVIIAYDLSQENYLDRVPLWVDECHSNECFLLYGAGTKRDLVDVRMEDKDRINEVMKQCKVNSMLYSVKEKSKQNDIERLVQNIMNAKNELYRSECTHGPMYKRETFLEDE